MHTQGLASRRRQRVETIPIAFTFDSAVTIGNARFSRVVGGAMSDGVAVASALSTNRWLFLLPIPAIFNIIIIVINIIIIIVIR